MATQLAAQFKTGFYMKRKYDFDLNLLVSLHALIEEKSVSGAARRMGVTQPGMTYTLKMLRSIFQDTLILPNSKTAQMTDLAAELEPTLQELFQVVNKIIYHKGKFFPEHSEYQFRFFPGYDNQLFITQRLFERIHKEAPKVRVRVLPTANLDMLDRGIVEYMIWHSEPDGWYHCHPICHSGFKVIANSQHPIVSGDKLSPEDLAVYEHVAVENNLESKSPVESLIFGAFQRNRITRRRTAIVTSYEMAANMVEATDSIAIVPDYITFKNNICSIPSPIAIDSLPIYLVWHERIHRHPAHIWFRSLLIDILIESYADTVTNSHSQNAPPIREVTSG